jgi:hypothetical protein
MQTLDKQTVELDNSCTCTEDDGSYAPYCLGCWDDSKELYAEMLEDWKKAVDFGDEQVVRIDGRAMTWLRREGYAVVDADKVLDALTINGDFRLVFTLDGAELTCIRYSHDEPTGASFSFSPMVQVEED